MKRLMKHTIIAATALMILPVSQAGAFNNFTSHHLVDEKNYEQYAEQLSAEHKLELREFLEYQKREPCQFYRPVPEGFVREGCGIAPSKRMKATRVSMTQDTERRRITPMEVVADYEIYFAYDSAEIQPKAARKIDKIARELKKHNPQDVTVAGHTDRAGPADYNVKLSQRRANAVSEALTEHGVTNRVLDKEAYGESKPAVHTGNGVRLRENRRVVVEFRK